MKRAKILRIVNGYNPRKRKLNNGEFQTIPGKVEVFVYHAKNKLAGPFKSKDQAILQAKELISKNIRYNKVILFTYSYCSIFFLEGLQKFKKRLLLLFNFFCSFSFFSLYRFSL